MILCPYGQCRMRNLCRGDHCVRGALEKDGYRLLHDGTLEKIEVNSRPLTESGANPTKAPS